MKKKALLKPKSLITIFVVVVLLLVAYFIYSRPMTITQLYPMLTLDKCSGIEGYYRDGTGKDLEKFAIEKNSEEFELLCDLLYKREYSRSLRDLLPRGTRIHPSEPGDFEWEVMFHFDAIEFSDGNVGSGPLLQIQYWYGELDIENSVFEDQRFCHTDEQDAWAKEILYIIR